MKRLVRLALVFTALLVFGVGCRQNAGTPQPPVKAESKDLLKGMSDEELLSKIKPRPK
jgi:hypothetical protein